MNIIINIDDVKTSNIFYQHPVKNTIMDNSNFIRLIYSTDYYTLNNLLIEEKSFFNDPESGETFITEGRTINNKREGTWKFFNNDNAANWNYICVASIIFLHMCNIIQMGI